MPRLKPKQERAALMLAEGTSQADVARRLDVAPQTIGRWVKNPDFLERIEELMSDLISQSVELLREKVLDNTKIILDIAAHGGDTGVVASQLKAALWAVEKVMGAPEKIAAHQDKLSRSIENRILGMKDDELEELLERGTD